jgi:hypothetical protein
VLASSLVVVAGKDSGYEATLSGYVSSNEDFS